MLHLKYHLEISIRNYIVTTIRQVHAILTSMPSMLDRYATPCYAEKEYLSANEHATLMQ